LQESDSRVTRSSSRSKTIDSTSGKKSIEADFTFYSKVQNDEQESIQVVSKRKLKSNPDTVERLKQSLDKVKEWEAARDLKEAEALAAEARKAMEACSPESKQTTPQNRLVFYVTHFNLFLYATCFFIQTGTLPFLTKKLGADPVVFGQLQTAFAIAQLAGGPIYGRLGDLMGERVALVLAFASATASYAIMGLATSIEMLFLSRAFSVLLHVMQGSQMVMAYLSPEAERTSSLAKLGFSYGIGMVVGPSLGGFVTKAYGEQASALVAAAGSLLSLLLVIVFIPNVKRQQTDSKEDTSSKSVLNLGEIAKLLFRPGVAMLLSIKLMSGVPIGILQSMFSIIAIEQFGLAADQTGMVLSYVGVISLLMQGFGIGAITTRFPEKAILQFSTVTLTIAYFILTMVRGLEDFLLLLLPLTCSMSLIHSILTSALTNAAPKGSTGQMLGMNMAVHSAIRSFAPSVGGLLIAHYGLWAIGAVGIVANILALLLAPFTNVTKTITA